MTRPRVPDPRHGWHRLVFTADGDLDFGWLILVVCCVVGLGAFIASGLHHFDASRWAWAWFGSFTALAFIAGAAISRARLIAKSALPGQIAAGINQAPYPGMDQGEAGP